MCHSTLTQILGSWKSSFLNPPHRRGRQEFKPRILEAATEQPLKAVILAPPIETPYFSQPIFDLAYLEAQQQQPSPYASSATSEATLFGEHPKHKSAAADGVSTKDASLRSAKRIKVEQPSSGMADSSKNDSVQMVASQSTVTSAPADAAASRPKRVRTGCLTCRERHLKCDEGTPDCQNCRKSSRPCKRGVRLNFIDTQVKTPPITPPTQEWDVVFQDESREIASEYRGGLSRYAHLVVEQGDLPESNAEAPYTFPGSMVDAPTLSHQQLPSIQSLPPGGVEAYSGNPEPYADQVRDRHRHPSTTSDSTFSSSTIPAPPQPSYGQSEQTVTPPIENRACLDSPEKVLFMQVFVEEVGLWMDSMDPYKHV